MQAVNSALYQTYSDKEVVVVDDGSTDGTGDILAQYGSNIHLVRKPNGGVSSACNAGVARATGESIAFLDGDDEWYPDKLKKQVSMCGGSAISHTDSVCFGEHLQREVRRSDFEPAYSGMVLEKLLVTNFITKSSVMMNRNLYLSEGGFVEGYKGVEDWPFWLKICAKHEIGYVPEPLIRYRVHQTSKSMNCRETLRDHLRIIGEAFAAGGVGSAFPQLRTKALASSYGIHSHYAAETGDWKLSAQCAAKAILAEPRVLYMYKRLIKALLMPVGVPY